MYNNSHHKPKKTFVNDGRAPDTLKLLLPKRKLSTKTTKSQTIMKVVYQKKKIEKNFRKYVIKYLPLLRFIIQIFIQKYRYSREPS